MSMTPPIVMKIAIAASIPNGAITGAGAGRSDTQVPSRPGRSHSSPGWSHGVSQQTLSAQVSPLMHCEVAVHEPP
jgi:hypothetical protein